MFEDPKPIYTVALHNSGGIRAPLQAGPVTSGDLLEVLPFGSTFDSFVITMKTLREALENSASKLGKHGKVGSGRLLQVAGKVS